MKNFVSLFVFGGLFMSSCEEDPNIQIGDFQTKPVVYSVIESFDTVHYIKIGRYFSGYANPAVSARVHDSIYFSTASVRVTLFNSHSTGVDVPVEKISVAKRDSGFFDSGGYELYRFKKELVKGSYPYYYLPYEQISVDVFVPGLPAARSITSLVFPPTIWAPIQAQQYIYIFPDSPLRILWSGGDWNEIDVGFRIIEDYPGRSVTRTFAFQKNNDININGKYYEIKIPYDLVVETLEKNLKVDRNLIRRHFGTFRIAVHTGNADFGTYMNFINGINDFNFTPFSNITNGVGLLAGKCSTIKDNMNLDQPSRLQFAAEPRLKKFNFIEY